jgi:hypothetical protein
MGILSWLLNTDKPADSQNKQKIDAIVEGIMRLNPHLRLARRYQARLAPAVATSLEYVGTLVDSIPAAREASAAVWSADPYIHAFFVSADDVPKVISRSAELREFFERHADVREVHAVLGMEMTERHILGVGMEGDILRRDVPQTTVSFGDHQVRMCGRTHEELRAEIVQRLLDQLAIAGMERIAADEERRDQLERERALMKTRLQLLERQGNGIRVVLGSDAATEAGELQRLAAQLEENERNIASLGLREDALDRELDHVRDVFAEPAQHISILSKRLRLDRMNVVQEGNSAQPSEELDLKIARIPTSPPRTRAFSLIRFSRDDLLVAKSALDDAARLLSSGLFS